MSWKTVLLEDNTRHVYPLDEEDRHNLDWTIEIGCPCSPRIIDGIIVHASFDGREGIEEAMEIINPKK